MEIFRKFIAGKYSLLTTFWLVAVPTALVGKLIGHYGDLQPGSIVAISYVATGSLITFINTLAVWNSAGNYLGQTIWKWLARVLCVPPMFVAVSLALMLLNKPNFPTKILMVYVGFSGMIQRESLLNFHRIMNITH